MIPMFSPTLPSRWRSPFERQQRKEYDGISSAKEFAKTLTDHLQEVSHDKHLRVFYSYEALPDMKESKPSPEEQEKQRRFGQFINFGFEKVERLSGNVGYLDFRGFIPPEDGGDTAAAAMNFLANTSALIIDLRQNGGGHPAMVAFISSYLFDAEPVHLNDIYWRPDNSTHQWWTLPHVPGKRYGNKPVFVLTSHETFSAAEEFAYNLKNLKRATLVGETTGGGAHPGGAHRVSEHFMTGVPSGRAINPISGTNWEGTGVKPDMEVPKELALKTAHRVALQKVLETNPNAPFADELKKALETVQKELEEMKRN
jgi:C-terminal processing protease CtpA/Prc